MKIRGDEARQGGSAMQYPHWLMVAGACLVLFGFIGLAFRQTLRRLKRIWSKPLRQTLPGWRTKRG
jgi:hypothetical protein